MNGLPLQQAFARASRQALQWRLLLLWLLALLLPLLMAALPLWLALAAALDRVPAASRLVEGLDITVLAETLMSLGPRGYSPSSGLGALLALALLMPWLTGLVVTAARSALPLGFAPLLKGGLAEYGAMARLYLWSLIPLGLAGAAGGALVHWAGEQAQTLTLESSAQWLRGGMLAVAALLLWSAQCTLDAARAQWVLEPRKRSVIKAWWRGTRGLWRQPRRLALLAAITLAGLLGAALLGALRLQVAPVGAVSFGVALALGQALVAVLVWMRCARLLGLAAVARAG